MKRADKQRVARAIQAVVPELYVTGPLLAVTPRGRILRGIFLDDSMTPDVAYVYAFVQPLYVPQSTIVLSFGERLGGGSKSWSIDELDALIAMVREAARPFFAVSSPEAFVRWPYLADRTDYVAQAARAYSLVACGEYVAAVRALREFAGAWPAERQWEIEGQERALHLAELAETNPAGARALLDTWEAETVSALRLENIP